MKDQDPESKIADGLYREGALSESLGDLLVQCIDESLTDLLGKRTREAIYDYLERNRSLSKSDIPEHTNEFFELLDETFGKGSKTIGRSIIRKMFEKLGLKFVDIPGYGFIDYLESVRAGNAERFIDYSGPESTLL